MVPSFHRGWLGGMSIASALPAAQLELLRELRAGRIGIGTPAGQVAIAETPVL